MKRVLAFSPYADMLWLETKSPDLKQATGFAREIREKYPGKYVQLCFTTCTDLAYMPGLP